MEMTMELFLQTRPKHVNHHHYSIGVQEYDTGASLSIKSGAQVGGNKPLDLGHSQFVALLTDLCPCSHSTQVHESALLAS